MSKKNRLIFIYNFKGAEWGPIYNLVVKSCTDGQLRDHFRSFWFLSPTNADNIQFPHIADLFCRYLHLLFICDLQRRFPWGRSVRSSAAGRRPTPAPHAQTGQRIPLLIFSTDVAEEDAEPLTYSVCACISQPPSMCQTGSSGVCPIHPAFLLSVAQGPSSCAHELHLSDFKLRSGFMRLQMILLNLCQFFFLDYWT